MEKMNKEQLQGMTARELRKIAGDLNVTGRWDMTKEQLVEAITKTQSESDAEEKCEVAESVGDESVVEASNKTSGDAEEKEEKESATAKSEEQVKEPKKMKTEEEMLEDKMKYLRNIKKGTIVAFKVEVMGNIKVKSAAVENVSQKREMLKLVTNYGMEYIVPFKDVVWVRTNSRWPRTIYDLLKGVKKLENKKG